MDSQDFRVERLYREVSCDLKQIPFDAKGSVVTSAQRIHPTQPRLCHFFPFPILRLASQTECGISTPKLVSLRAAVEYLTVNLGQCALKPHRIGLLILRYSVNSFTRMSEDAGNLQRQRSQTSDVSHPRDQYLIWAFGTRIAEGSVYLV